MKNRKIHLHKIIDRPRQILFPPPSLSSKNQTEKAAENWRCCVGLLLPPAATAAAHKR
jgi:hypothetical protein